MNYKKNYKYGGLYSMLAQGGKPDYLDLDKDGNKEELMREAAKQMSKGGRVYRFGGVNKYPHGGVHNNTLNLAEMIPSMGDFQRDLNRARGNASGPGTQTMAKDSSNTGNQGEPVLGSARTGQRFRVIPEKSSSGQTEMAYYIDGRPVSVSDFQKQFYAQGFGPGDVNKMIEDSMKARAQGIGVKSMISAGGPNEARDRAYRDALQERNAYRDSGAAGVDSLYNARNENYARNMLLRGGE